MHRNSLCDFLGLLCFGWIVCVGAIALAADNRPLAVTSDSSESSAAGEQVASRELWLVSTRHLPSNPCCCPIDRESLEFRYWRHDGDCSWNASDSANFNDSSAPIAVLIPGAPATLYDTKRIGKQIYDRFMEYLPADAPIRFVIWTWPTEKSYRMRLRDMRVKASIAESQGFYLAHFIDAQAADVPVGLLGYSFGARMTTASLHLLGGGRIQGCRSFQTKRPAGAGVQAVLTAGALDDWWLCEDGRHCRALEYADRILNTYNRCDPLLTKYHLLYGLRRGPSAIGLVGSPTNCFGENGSKFEQVNVTRWIGSSHEPQAYLNPEYLALTAPTLLSLREEAGAAESP